MAQVFISYSRREIRFVKKLAEDFEAKGYDVWFDLTDIEGGDRWANEIQKGIKASEYFVLVVSSNSIKSEWVEKEFLYASNKKLKIIPILFDDCEADLPIWLLNIQYIDMRVKRHYQKNLNRIIAAFGEEEPPPERPKESKLDVASLLKKPATMWGGGAVLLALILMIIFSLKPNTPPPDPTKEPTATATATKVVSTATETQKPMPTETEAPIEPTLTPEPDVIPTATPLPSEITDKSGAEMVLIPAADFFWMGSDSGESDARPAHPMKVDNFYIDKFEVTNAQYLACVNTASCAKPEDTRYFFDAQKRYANHPVVYISWQDAVDFCEWREARLPSEVEWEKAARGTDQRIYPWGNQWNNKYANATGADDGYVGSAPVNSFEDHLSPYGIYNMAGNVWEWTADWYDIYPNGDDKASPYFGELRRVARGGSWADNKNSLLTYKRYDLNPETKPNSQIGFRCAADVP